MVDARDGSADPRVARAHTAMPTLRGRRVIVTGGTTGIGRATAILLATEGARVFVCGRDERHLADALAQIRAVGDGDGIALDLARPAAVGALIDAAMAALGGLDAIVINAAVAAGGLQPIGEEALLLAVATDFTACLLVAKRAARDMPEGGDIILMGSMSAVSPDGDSTVYAAAKAGIEGFATALRKELAPGGIRVALIEPGRTGSDLLLPEVPVAIQRQQIAASRMLRAQDVAVVVHQILTQPRRTVISLVRIEPLIVP